MYSDLIMILQIGLGDFIKSLYTPYVVTLDLTKQETKCWFPFRLKSKRVWCFVVQGEIFLMFIPIHRLSLDYSREKVVLPCFCWINLFAIWLVLGLYFVLICDGCFAHLVLVGQDFSLLRGLLADATHHVYFSYKLYLHRNPII